jgi:predicted DNA-binding protein
LRAEFGIVNPSVWYYFKAVKTISYKIDSNLYAWLEKQSKRLGKSKSAITREALEKSRREKSEPSCHDLMSDVCGTLDSGVRDLATNKKYLKGFGEWKR